MHSVAGESLAEAVGLLETTPARYELALALADLGAFLRRSGRRADARDPLRRALDLAQRTGAAPLAERARRELLAAGARPRRTALTGPDALTSAERRVAGLAADGLSNRQIAQHLFITQPTVETHLRHAFQKLGITSRAGLGYFKVSGIGAPMSSKACRWVLVGSVSIAMVTWVPVYRTWLRVKVARCSSRPRKLR